MIMLAVNDQRITFTRELIPALPNLLHKGTGGVKFVGINAVVFELLLHLDSSTEGGYNHNIIFIQRLNRNELSAVGLKQKADAAFQQILVDRRVVDHLAEQVDILLRIVGNRIVGDVNGIFDAIAEAKVAGHQKAHGTEIQYTGLQILLAGINDLVGIFHLANNRRMVDFGDIELLTAHGIS